MGTLYITATPIGNLEDITVRALRILRSVRVIAAEDTRHSLKLLSHYGISARLIAYHDHNKASMTAALLDVLAREDLALLTDAGTPGISDPGYEIIGAALEAGYPVDLVPGADAITTLIAAAPRTAAGDLPFRFVGFPPRKESALRDLLTRLAQAREILVLYESPNRLAKTLEAIHTAYGDRQLVVGIELTKFFEEITIGPAGELATRYAKAPIRGEAALLIYPAS